MTAIVIVVVPTREAGVRSVNPIPARRKKAECEPQPDAINPGDGWDPPFWTWFIENPRGGDRAVI